MRRRLIHAAIRYLQGLLPHGEMTTQELREELARAYRCIVAFDTATDDRVQLRVVRVYHITTRAAARRFIREGALDGTKYFEGKPLSVLHAALEVWENPTERGLRRLSQIEDAARLVAP